MMLSCKQVNTLSLLLVSEILSDKAVAYLPDDGNEPIPMPLTVKPSGADDGCTSGDVSTMSYNTVVSYTILSHLSVHRSQQVLCKYYAILPLTFLPSKPVYVHYLFHIYSKIKISSYIEVSLSVVLWHKHVRFVFLMNFN